jgi:glycosyltransferase involved in cell wall biosynthesis
VSGTADVTVVVPARDRAHLLGRALESVAAQSLLPRAVVVVDDGSTDDTAEVARAHGADVIRLERSGGSGPARNRGIEAARTTWVAFLDSDDIWDSGHVAALMAHAAGHVLVTAPGRRGDRVVGNALGRNVQLSPLSLLDPGAMVFTSGTASRRDALLEAGLFRPLPRAQDLDMWLRVLEQGSGLALARPTVIYVTHDTQVSRDKALTRACFDQIVDDCAARPWFRPDHRDRAYTRWRWDELRASMGRRDLAATASSARWLVGRPRVWPTLGRVLVQRRMSRRVAG